MSDPPSPAPTARIGPGTRMGPYEVLSILGAGGMGEVWRARDSVLRREAAVKVLPAEEAGDRMRNERLLREARAASALNHPNIVTVYGAGEQDGRLYVASEIVEGSTLREAMSTGALPPLRAVDIARQVLAGLVCAHNAGIVHRDLKPENLMLTADGRVKILDFGLAKPSADSPPEAADTSLTGKGSVLGTTAYMSPEQARGERVDGRSDLFAVGVILYEMLSGRHPFRRGTPIDTASAILREPPPPLPADGPAIPGLVRDVVARALAKERGGRFRDASAMTTALGGTDDLPTVSGAAPLSSADPHTASGPRSRRYGLAAAGVALALVVVGLAVAAIRQGRWPAFAGRTSAPRALAVLPFDSPSGGSDETYFADGMTEAIITDLSRLEALPVIAANSVMRYRGRPAEEAVRALGASHVLLGTVRRAGGRLRVTASLVEASSGLQVWAERYDRDAKDVFAVQDDISRSIVSALRVALTARVAERPATESLEAYDAYLRARAHLLRNDPKREAPVAAELLERATALDPKFARAYAALGAAYAGVAFMEDSAGVEGKANAAIDRALALDPTIAEAYVARGNLMWTREHGFPHERAAAEYRHALALEPQSSAALTALGSVMVHVGLVDESEPLLARAIALDPLNVRARFLHARTHLYEQRYGQALRELEGVERGMEKARALIGEGRLDEAAQVLDGAPPDMLANGDASSVRALLLALRGDRAGAIAQAERAAARGGAASHFHHASYYIAAAYAVRCSIKRHAVWMRDRRLNGWPVVAREHRNPIAGHQSENAASRIHPHHAVVRAVGNVEVIRTIEADAARPCKLSVYGGPAGATGTGHAGAGYRGDHPGLCGQSGAQAEYEELPVESREAKCS